MTDTDRLAALLAEGHDNLYAPILLDEEYVRFAAFLESRGVGLAATPAPLDVDDGWQERGNPGDDATPAPLDVSRLARVMRDMCDCIRSDSDAEAWARDIAAAYQADES